MSGSANADYSGGNHGIQGVSDRQGNKMHPMQLHHVAYLTKNIDRKADDCAGCWA